MTDREIFLYHPSMASIDNLHDKVLTYSKLADWIKSRSNPDLEKKKVCKIIDEIAADYSQSTLDAVCRFLNKLFSKFYDKIDFNTIGFRPEKYQKDCIVFVPNHQSHADYLALNYNFFRRFTLPIYTAGGINLNIFPIGKIFRKCGCFFIRRMFHNNPAYKMTLEAYLYCLLKEGCIVQFFFEGGRSRNGKLRPPRFGLYTMLYSAYEELLKEAPDKQLLFIPISINHEYLPESKSLTRELKGGRKVPESSLGMLRLLKLLTYRFGSLHIRFGEPISLKADVKNPKSEIDRVAFKCFRRVGQNLMVTPSALLSMALLDEPAGALRWVDILAKGRVIRNYCREFGIPLSEGLLGDSLVPTLERMMDIFVGNKKIEVIGKFQRGEIYYTIRRDCRLELLYFKNTILHHFLIASIINLAWVKILRGDLKEGNDLKTFFLSQRGQLKYEFYLPTIRQVFYWTLNIVNVSVGRRVGSLDEIMKLSQAELYSIIRKVGVFGRSLSYIFEGYYLSALAVRDLTEDFPEGFKREFYVKKVREVYLEEVGIGRIVRYPESFSVDLMDSSMKYFRHIEIIKNVEGTFQLTDRKKLDKIIELYEKDLVDLVTFNIRIQ